MPDAIKEALTQEQETISTPSDAMIRELTLRIITADTSYAGTNAGVVLQVGNRVFLLEDGLGHEATLDPNTSQTNRLDRTPKAHAGPKPEIKAGGFQVELGPLTYSKKTMIVGGREQKFSGWSVGGLDLSAESLRNLQELHAMKHDGNHPRPKLDEFERGQTNLFHITGKEGSLHMTLEQLRDAEIKLFHDTKGATSDWNIDKINLSVSYLDTANKNQFYKTWEAVGWLQDDSPAVLLQRGATR